MLQTTEIEFSYKNKKILLLHGPPGGGKSTLAEILAKQCGYKPVIVNCSDERDGTTLVHKIENATEMNTIMDSGALKTLGKGLETERAKSRPVCLILDEADGAMESYGMNQVARYLKKRIDASEK